MQETETAVVSKDSLLNASFDRESLQKNTTWDKFGGGISVACAVKCAGLPVLTAALPSLSTLSSISHSPVVAWGFTALAAPGAVQLMHDAMKRNIPANAVLGSSGLTLMALGAIGHTMSHGAHDHAGHGTHGMDHSSMDHSAMDHSKHRAMQTHNEHSIHDHSKHGMSTSTQEPAAIVYDQNASQTAFADLSHYAFLAGSVVLAAGHIKRHFQSRVQSRP